MDRPVAETIRMIRHLWEVSGLLCVRPEAFDLSVEELPVVAFFRELIGKVVCFIQQ